MRLGDGALEVARDPISTPAGSSAAASSPAASPIRYTAVQRSRTAAASAEKSCCLPRPPAIRRMRPGNARSATIVLATFVAFDR